MGTVAAVKISEEKDSFEELENLVSTMSRALVDHPKEVLVQSAKGDGFVAFEVVCSERDAGALIGTRGRHAEAMRLLLMASGAVRKTRVTVQFLSRDQHGLPSR